MKLVINFTLITLGMIFVVAVQADGTNPVLGKWKINADETVKYTVMAVNRDRKGKKKVDVNSKESIDAKNKIKTQSRNKHMQFTAKDLRLVQSGRTVTTLPIVNFRLDKKTKFQYITVKSPQGNIQLVVSFLNKNRLIMRGMTQGIVSVYDRI